MRDAILIKHLEELPHWFRSKGTILGVVEDEDYAEVSRSVAVSGKGINDNGAGNTNAFFVVSVLSVHRMR